MVANPDIEVRSIGVVQCHIVYLSIKSDLTIRIHHCIIDVCVLNGQGISECAVYRTCTVTFGSLYLVA